MHGPFWTFSRTYGRNPSQWNSRGEAKSACDNPIITTMQQTTATPATRPLRILYADDMEEVRDAIQSALSLYGHEVECATDGLRAWQRISGDPAAFDVVITDHQMPNMNGLELVSRLRSLPFLGKILLFTSGLNDDVREAYQRLKVDNMLNKPVFPAELRQALAAL
jgi:two-component system chemotaxis response regulator CheY